ncbi:MAG: hypothetical protein ACLS5G_00295 [Streptococcus sp.]
MSFIQVTKEEFNTHAQQVSERSFMQTEKWLSFLKNVDLALLCRLERRRPAEVSAIVTACL